MVAPTGSTNPSPLGMNWQQRELAPLQTPAAPQSEANPASMTLEEALGEKPKKKSLFEKFMIGAGLVGMVYGLAALGRAKIPIMQEDGLLLKLRKGCDWLINNTDQLFKKAQKLWNKGADEAVQATD